MQKEVMNVIFLAIGVLFSAPGFAQTNNIVVTPGSSAAYVFCTKPTCLISERGGWLFKLDPSYAVDFLGNGGLDWNSTFKDRWYIGYGEFRPTSADKKSGTFSGVVDVPPTKAAPYTAYGCTIGPAGAPPNPATYTPSESDTPLRSCTDCGASGWPNTGLVVCDDTFVIKNFLNQTMGQKIGYCVAHYVRLRPTGTCQYLYQGRIKNLKVTEISECTLPGC